MEEIISPITLDLLTGISEDLDFRIENESYN